MRSLTRRIFFVAALAVLVIALPLHAERYGAVLTGAQEAPTPVTTNGYGNATVTLDPSHTSLTLDLTVAGLTSPVTLAHIHEAARGVAGGVRVDFNPNANMTNGRISHTYTITKEIGDAIAANPQNYYVNVHTSNFGGGEIRGQLTPLDTTVTYAGELRGANENPPVTTTAVGSFFITLDAANNMTWEINTGGVTSPTLSHIHVGAAGTNGGVVVTFASSAAAFNGRRVTGRATLTTELANQIRANPAGYYVNVHTTANPTGELRGQLVAANEYIIPVAGKVAGANGENFVSDIRIFNPSYTSRATALLEYFQRGTSANESATTSYAVDIPPRGTALLDDAANSAQLNAPAGTIGAVRVSSSSQLAVTSAIYDDRRARGGGTIGQFVPAVSRANALRRGVLPQLLADGIMRTNVGIFNPNAWPVDVHFELRDPTGALLGSGTAVLPAFSQQQNPIASYFGGVDTTHAHGLTMSFDAGAPIVVYASVIDGTSADQIMVMAQPDPGVNAAQ